MQLVDVVSEILVLPDWAPKLILLMLVVGFIPALILAWAFELTPEGIKLEKDVSRTQSITPKTGRKLDLTIIAGTWLWRPTSRVSTEQSCQFRLTCFNRSSKAWKRGSSRRTARSSSCSIHELLIAP